MTAHWIDGKCDKWVLRLEVVGFKGISGGHNGDNLGRYFMGLCDRVRICSRKESKVHRLVSLSHATELPDSILTLRMSTSCNRSRWTMRQTMEQFAKQFKNFMRVGIRTGMQTKTNSCTSFMRVSLFHRGYLESPGALHMSSTSETLM
jgi:hypothetical protein